MPHSEVAVHAEHSVPWRVALLPEPLIEIPAAPSADLRPVLLPSAVDVVYREKLFSSFATASTEVPAVGGIQFLLQPVFKRLVLLFDVLQVRKSVCLLLTTSKSD